MADTIDKMIGGNSNPWLPQNATLGATREAAENPNVSDTTRAPDMNAFYLSVATPHPVAGPAHVVPIPDESPLTLSRDKGAAVGDVLHVLAGAESGSIEHLVNQAIANRMVKNNSEGEANGQATRRRSTRDDSDADAEDDDPVLSVLRAGARALRHPLGKVRRNMRG